MKIALFSQSLFSLPLEDAIDGAARIGFSAVELACARPHFHVELARTDPERVAGQIRRNGLSVSGLSLFNDLTDVSCRDEQFEEAETFIRLAPLFGTDLLKLTPGPPGSAAATQAHWDRLAAALERLVPVAEDVGVRLAFETHMRQLTDTLTGARRLLHMAPSPAVGLTVDFSNLAFAGENLPEAIAALVDRTYNAHVKNGTVGADGSWHFHALDTGLTDYAEVLAGMRVANYEGYLTIECLGNEAREKPLQTARRDLRILRSLLGEK